MLPPQVTQVRHQVQVAQVQQQVPVT